MLERVDALREPTVLRAQEQDRAGKRAREVGPDRQGRDLDRYELDDPLGNRHHEPAAPAFREILERGQASGSIEPFHISDSLESCLVRGVIMTREIRSSTKKIGLIPSLSPVSAGADTSMIQNKDLARQLPRDRGFLLNRKRPWAPIRFHAVGRVVRGTIDSTIRRTILQVRCFRETGIAHNSRKRPGRLRAMRTPRPPI
jgi:hypothetical protein